MEEIFFGVNISDTDFWWDDNNDDFCWCCGFSGWVHSDSHGCGADSRGGSGAADALCVHQEGLCFHLWAGLLHSAWQRLPSSSPLFSYAWRCFQSKEESFTELTDLPPDTQWQTLLSLLIVCVWGMLHGIHSSDIMFSTLVRSNSTWDSNFFS